MIPSAVRLDQAIAALKVADAQSALPQRCLDARPREQSHLPPRERQAAAGIAADAAGTGDDDPLAPSAMLLLRTGPTIRHENHNVGGIVDTGLALCLAVTGPPLSTIAFAMTLPTDPAENLAALIRCASVTPAEGGALSALETMLKPLGFLVDRPVFSEDGTPDIENLYARRSGNGPHLMFAGHTDVVPVGDEAAWTHPPFAAEIANGEMYGRGAVDMKGGIACFVAAVARHVAAQGRPQGLGLAADHRRRGRAGDQRHGQAARMGGVQGRELGRRDRRRADQSRTRSAT